MAKKKPSAKQPLLFELQEQSTLPQPNIVNDSDDSSLPFESNVESISPASATFEFDDRSTPAVLTQRQRKDTIEPDDLVILIDSHSLIYQVFHALPSMTGPNGMEVGAVHGFLRDIAELRDRWKPDFLVCTFDESDFTFRNELYDQYKAHREPMPEALRAQIPLIHNALEILDIPRLSLSGFEADDILATVAKTVADAGARCFLVTSDKDCRQLLSENVKMLNIRKNELFGPEELHAVWGIEPYQVVDFQAMVGDSVDNVPGVPQIGPKAAQQLLAEFKTLENILENVERVTGAKRQQTLRENRANALLSQQLARLRIDVPIVYDWNRWSLPLPNAKAVEELFRELGFRRLAERFVVESTNAASSLEELDLHERIDRSTYRCVTQKDAESQLGDAIAERPTAINPSPLSSERPVLQSLASLQEELESHFQSIPLDQPRWLAIDTETTSLSSRDALPVGYSLCWAPGKAAYIPVKGEPGDRIVDIEVANAFMKRWLEDESIQKIGQNIKYDLVVIRSQGIEVKNVAMDTMVADYLLEPGSRNHNLDELAKRYLNHDTITIDTLIGTGKNQIRMDEVNIDRVAVYASEDVDVPFRLRSILEPKLNQASLDNVFQSIEMPLIEVLAEMEFNGIAVDIPTLQQQSEMFSRKIESLQFDIRQIAGGDLNPDSPKQLAVTLFEKLGLPVIKKNKTGPSTDVEVLQELALVHPLPAKIVEYRQATKLKSTYIDALPRLVSPNTGRIHTSFRQDIAATGRLSSSEPNLQNIPIRTEEGRAIRSAFKPGPEGWLLMTADYSQIELRVLAHYCGDPSLRAAFDQNEDIHTRVASEVHGVAPDQVTSAMRRAAKAINFGIIYGQSPFGLAKALNISKADAADFIDTYFARYQSVRSFMRQTLDECRRDGFVKTISGRKRYLKGIRDFSGLNPQQQKTLLEPERMAVNTVIQGSAADLIKLAMINVHRALKTAGLNAKLLLQIHDELVFEVAPEDANKLSSLVRHEMTNAIPLDVPIQVDVKLGPNWAACELT